MVITKGSKTANILAELINPSYTQKATTNVSYVEFVKDKGIYIRFDDAIESLFITDKTVDFSCEVVGSYLVTVLNFTLAKNDANISFINGKVMVSGFAFDTRDEQQFESVNFSQAHITFTKEQWAKLEKDFVATAGNTFKNPRITDVVNFTVHQGVLYKTLPNISHWEISKFDATIDDVGLSQEYGHTTKIWGLPKKVWSLLKEADEVQLFLASYNKILAKADGLELVYSIYPSKNTAFLDMLEKRTNGQKCLTIKDISANGELLRLLEDSKKYAFEQEEDKNCLITVEEGELKFEVDTNASTKFEIAYSGPTVKISVDLVVLEHVLKYLPEDTEIREYEKSIIFVNGDKTIFVANRGTPTN